MFIALYEMKAKEGKEAQFEQAWAEVTDFIYATRGSLGSRLHKTEQERVYIAYAQWPSRDVYFGEQPSDIPPEQQAARASMKDSLEYVVTQQLMEVCDDRLAKEVKA